MIHDGECGIFSPKLLECFDDAREELTIETQKEQQKVENGKGG